MPVRFVWAALVAAVCCGCGPDRPPLGTSSGSHDWTREPAGVPGLDTGHCYYSGKLFVLWSTEGRDRSAGSTRTDAGGISGEGHVVLTNGRKVAFSFRLPDERSGTAVVDGTQYDLTNGRLFLVRPAGDACAVKQLDKDLSAFDPSADLAALGRADPAIRTFFEAGPKP